MRTASSSAKLLVLKDLIQKIEDWRAVNKTIAFTNGVFDLLHVGHIYSLESAALFADVLIVGVNSDKSVRTLNKGTDRPFLGEEERAKLVAGLGCVDAVVIFNETTPFEVLSQIKPDVLVKGDDWARDKVIGREFAGRVELIKRLGQFSTTNLVEKIKMTKN